MRVGLPLQVVPFLALLSADTLSRNSDASPAPTPTVPYEIFVLAFQQTAGCMNSLSP